MSDMDRFLSKVRKTDGCWYWTGARKPSGYGNFYMQRKHLGAHCASFRLFTGDIPPGMYVCHSCDTPACVNPEHLFLGTPLQNQADCVIKGRRPRGEQSGVSKLRADQVDAIRRRRKMGEKLSVLATCFGVSQATISLIARHRSWA